ncbi:macoilin-1-like isoform X2 [Watersipora subatra]|uniref:macoilin-1-like isoform X2 n=1 Tax=Watersipora subatra TaxID=2589382 RepID=UPI00355B525F
MIMKRRNVENGKLRRPLKFKKTSESNHSSLFSYAKFLIVWCLVLIADFLLEFRFEYLYPAWLLLCSAYDSYKYQGVLLTALFVMAAIGADIFCYIFIPVQWLFFAASSYVWVQYVWQTDKGLCLSSVTLWLIFIYVEAVLRIKDARAPRSFNMDLTRPFAAHCIGYPVVTLGYGIKTAATESLRRRTRQKVKKSNHFYHHLLQEALPIELQESRLTDDANEDGTASSECAGKSDAKGGDISDTGSDTSDSGTSLPLEGNGTERISINGSVPEKHAITSNSHPASNQNNDSGHSKTSFIEEFDADAEKESRELHRRTVNYLSEESENMINLSKSKKVPNRDQPQSTRKLNPKKGKGGTASSSSVTSSAQTAASPVSNSLKPAPSSDSVGVKADYIVRLESDVVKLKADLQASRNTESELRSQLNSKSTDERQKKQCLTQLQQDNDNLQNKLHNLVVTRQQEKQNMSALEEKLQEEKKLREKSETLLASERKAKKEEEQVAARAVALANVTRVESCDCKAKIKELEDNNSKLQWEGTRRDEQIRHLVTENSDLRRNCQENHSQMNQELVKTAVNGYQIRIAELQTSLSTETKMKIELYQALGDMKRQCELQTQIIGAKDIEIAGLRSHITEALALVPSSMYTDQSLVSGQYTTPKLGTPRAGGSPAQHYISQPQTQQQPIFQHGVPPQPNSVVPGSPRFSPTSPRLVRESGSPNTAASEDTGYSELNPQAKDYLPGTPTTQ